jgi:LysR family cyn operon transcriptional activator
MDLARVRYFVAVAKHLNFTVAARELYMEQSALSRQIKLLEQGLGAPLFERNSRRVTLTVQGDALLPYALRALDEAQAGEDAVRRSASLSHGRLTVGATPQTMASIVAPFMADSREDLARLHLDLVEAGALELQQLLINDDLDVAIVTAPVAPHLATTSLGSSNLLVVGPADHPVLAAENIDIQDLEGQALVVLTGEFASRGLLNAVALHRRVGLDIACTSSSPTTVEALVTAGMGIGILPGTAGPATDCLASRRLTDSGDPVAVHLMVAWNPNRAAAARYTLFAQALTKHTRARDILEPVTSKGAHD